MAKAWVRCRFIAPPAVTVRFRGQTTCSTRKTQSERPFGDARKCRIEKLDAEKGICGIPETLPGPFSSPNPDRPFWSHLVSLTEG